MVRIPDTSSHVPAAVNQLALNVSLVGALPLPVSTFRPGQLNSLVALSSWFWIGCRLTSPSTTTMMMYGANAWNISLRVGGRPSSASFLRSSAASEVDPPAIAGAATGDLGGAGARGPDASAA